MTNSCDCQNRDCNCDSSSGFIFGLLCGAVIGAIIAIIIYKNNKTEVFENLSKKIKDFFDSLIKTNIKDPNPKDNSPANKKISPKLLASTPLEISKQEIIPVFVKPKKPVPKTFIKPKK